MAVAHVQTVKTARATDGTSVLTRSITATTGNLLIAVVCIRDTGSGNPTCSGVTWNGVAMTQRITRQASTTDSRVYIFSLPNITGATANVVATLNSASPVGTLFVTEVSGAVLTSEDDGVGASATSSGANPASGTFTASAADDFWVACFVNEAAGTDATIAAGSGWTMDATNGRHTDGSAGARAGTEYMANPASAGPFNGNFTAATGAWAAAVFAFKAAAPTGPTYQQEGYRFRNDDGSESTATWKAAQDTNATIAVDAPFRLRILTDVTNDAPSEQFQLEYREKGTGDPWEVVTIG